MRKVVFVIVVLCAGCALTEVRHNVSVTVPAERHLRNTTRLTSDGDNGEAYFSADGKRLVWQSSRGGVACDKIWTMNSDGSDKRMVSPDHGAHTCSYFFPDGKRIVLAFILFILFVPVNSVRRMRRP